MKKEEIYKILIDCKEKLPEKEGAYLTYNKNTDKYSISYRFYSNINKKWRWSNFNDEIPTHWLEIEE